MSSHPPPPHDHDALLQALATGDLDPASERAREELACCAECRGQAEALLARVRRLEAAGREQRQELAEVRALGSAPGEDRVERALAMAGAQSARRGRRLLLPLAAALLLLAGAGWWLAREASSDHGDGAEYLGPALDELEPSGPNASFVEFTWKYESGHAERFVVRVYDAKSPDVLLLQRPTPSSPWTPSHADLELLPDSIVWEVEALDAFGQVESGPVSASASRSSR